MGGVEGGVVSSTQEALLVLSFSSISPLRDRRRRFFASRAFFFSNNFAVRS